MGAGVRNALRVNLPQQFKRHFVFSILLLAIRRCLFQYIKCGVFGNRFQIGLLPEIILIEQWAKESAEGAPVGEEPRFHYLYHKIDAVVGSAWWLVPIIPVV